MGRPWLLTCALLGTVVDSVELTKETWDAAVEGKKSVFVKFQAPW